jgi:hypothetical protein
LSTRLTFLRQAAMVVAGALLLSACAGPPMQPGGPAPDPPPPDPPPNSPPVVVAIVTQGGRPKQPPGFVNVGDEVMVSATVTDEETELDQLEYQWSAPVGAFSGTGRHVTWTAPATAMTPRSVTLTLRVLERYGTGNALQQEATGTHTLALHDSERELGDMARRFLTEFSKPQSNKDWRDVMRDFNGGRCPDPRQADAERDDVVRHYTHFVMHNYNVGPAKVTINFGAACSYRNRPGDACVTVPVSWDSTDQRTMERGQTMGLDHVAGAYSTDDSRWWLCSSDYQPVTTFGHTFYLSR